MKRLRIDLSMLVVIMLNGFSIFIGTYLVNYYHIFTSTGYTIGLLEILSLSVTLMFLSISRYLLQSKDTLLWRAFDLLVALLTSLSLCIFIFSFYYSYLLESDIFKTKLDLFGIHMEKLYLNHEARASFINDCWDKYYSNVVDFVYLKYGDRIPSARIPSNLLEIVNKLDNKIDVEAAISKYCNQLKLDSIRDNYWYQLVDYTRNPLFISVILLILLVSIFKLNIDIYTLFNDFIGVQSDVSKLKTNQDEFADAFSNFSNDFTEDIKNLNSSLGRKIEDRHDGLSSHIYVLKQQVDSICAHLWKFRGDVRK